MTITSLEKVNTEEQPSLGLEDIKRKAEMFLSGEEVENKKTFEGLLVNHIARNLQVVCYAWKEVASAVSYVKAEAVYLRTGNYQTLEDWLDKVLIPRLKDEYGILDQKAGTLQQWANYYDLEQEMILLSPEGGRNILEMGLNISNLRSLLSLSANPQANFPAYKELDGFDAAKADLRKKITTEIAAQAELISVPDMEDAKEADKARLGAIAEHFNYSKNAAGKILADYFIKDGEIKVGKYYRYMNEVSWGEPEDTETGTKWTKFSVPGVKDDWVKVVEYDKEEQTIRIQPWMKFQLDLSKTDVREKNHMNGEGTILHDLSVANLDFSVGLTAEEVEDEILNVSLDLELFRNTFRSMFKECKVKDIEPKEFLEALVTDWAKNAEFAQRERDEERRAESATVIQVVKAEEEVA